MRGDNRRPDPTDRMCRKFAVWIDPLVFIPNLKPRELMLVLAEPRQLHDAEIAPHRKREGKKPVNVPADYRIRRRGVPPDRPRDRIDRRAHLRGSSLPGPLLERRRTADE